MNLELELLKAPSAPSEYGDILLVLKKKQFKPNISVERQIASHVRVLIQNKKIPAHTRLPPMRTLAKFWGTNYFTVQAALSRLVTEGLIVQSPKKGSFVAPPRRALSRVCLYHDHTLSKDWHNDYYSRLNISLYRLLAERGIGIVPFFDHRPEDKLQAMPTEVRDMAKDGEIDAVIATAIYPHNSGWLTKLEVPVTSTMLGAPHNMIHSDHESFARLAVEEAVKCGRKAIGLIHLAGSETEQMRLAVERAATERGISVVYPKSKTAPFHNLPWEQFSCQLTVELLSAEVQPDVIMVYPDTLIRGVVTALLQHQIRIPEQILLISHRNAESSIYVPFPVTWLTVKIEDVAQTLIDQIDRQIKGEDLVPYYIPVSVERTTPQYPV